VYLAPLDFGKQILVKHGMGIGLFVFELRLELLDN